MYVKSLIFSTMFLIGLSQSAFAQQVYRLSPAQIKQIEQPKPKPAQPVTPRKTYKRILVTGFQPYRHFKHNSSGQFALDLHGKVIGDYIILSATFPVQEVQVRKHLDKVIAKYRPDYVIGMGNFAPNLMKIETMAQNKFQNREASGSAKFEERPIDVGGPLVIPSTLEPQIDDSMFQPIVESSPVKTEPIKIVESSDAGNDVCQLMYYLTAKKMNGKALFFHLPTQNNDMDLAAYKGKYYPMLMKTLERVIQTIQISEK
jgi:pyrrolidone-carboxylate peptidase